MKTILSVIAVLCCTALFSQSGGLDSSFALAGKFLYQNNYPYNIYQANAVVVQKDGKIVLAGFGYNYNNYTSGDFALLRLNKDGSLDNTFGNGGFVLIDFSPFNTFYYTNDQANSLALQSDGKIVVAGTSFTYPYSDSSLTYNYQDAAVARLNSDGSLDNSFHGNGKLIIDLSAYTGVAGAYNSSYDYCDAVAIKGNGNIVLAGTTYINTSNNTNNYDADVIQLTTSGKLDSSFATNGVSIISKSGSDENISGLSIQKDGKIVLGGTTRDVSQNSDLLAIRLKANGTLDNSFASSGVLAVDITNNSDDYGGSVAIQSNNKILLGGFTTITDHTDLALIRLNANGSFDNSFGTNGKSLQANESFSVQTALAIQKDGKIIQTGSTYLYSNNNSNDFYYQGGENFLALRYKTDGSLDSSFGTYGRTAVDFGNYLDNNNDYSFANAIQPDGKIIVAGTNSSYQELCATRLLTSGKNYGLTGPGDQSDTLGSGECTATFNNLDPVLHPDTSLSLVKYKLYSNNNFYPQLYDSGYGSVSGKPFNIGNTTVVYTSAIDALQRAVFNVNVSGGTPAGALDFDGIDDRVLITSYLDPINSDAYGQYSFEGWIKVRKYNATGGSVIFGDERNNNGGILVELNEKGYVTTYQPTIGFVVSKYKVPLNKWTHIAFSQSNTSLDLYVNGKFVQTLLTAPYLHVSAYGNYYLGAYTTDDVNFSRNFNGEMDEVRIWGQAICAKQIQNNLHCEVYDYSQNLLAHFTFNEGLASCNNQSVIYLNGGFGSGILQNFALNGPVSNWVAGYVSGSCAVFTPLAITNYPNAITVPATNDSCGATVNFAVTVSSGCSDSVNIIYSQNPGTFFPTGTSYVSATAQDSYGNTVGVSFPITVTENTPPTLVLKDTSVALDQNGFAYINPYDLITTLTDNCSQYIPVYINSNTYFYCYNVGPNQISITATDQSGNSTTKTATVTVLPFAGSATLQAIPNPQQYSDYATLTATLNGAQNFYYNGCLSASDVTFKVGSKVISTASLQPDYYGNLIASTTYQLTDIFPKKITATFNGLSGSAYSLPNTTVSTTLNGTPENAVVDYIESQLISTSTNKLTIPVAAQLTDTADGSRGDIRKSIVTFTIQPVTAGATVTGSNTLTISSLEFVSADHTSGVARGNFTVNTGGSANAKFNVIVTVSNYYTGSKTVTVYVSKTSSGLITSDNKTALSPDAKTALPDGYFGVIVSPNPSSNQFMLQVTSRNLSDKINIRISDAAGKVLETYSNVRAGEIVHLGAAYRSGVYMAEISQGTNKKSYKLIKL